MEAANTLVDFLYGEYAIQRQIEDASAKQIEYSLNLFREFLHQEPTFDHLQDQHVTNFIVWLQRTKKMSQRYVKNVRANILALWRQAFDYYYVPVLPQRIPKVKTTTPYPEAWQWEEVCALLEATHILGHEEMANGIIRRLWWQCYILMGYESAFRGCDLLQIRFHAIDRSGCVKIIQKKTGRPHIVRLSDTCLEAIQRIRNPRREIILAWPHRPKVLQYWFQKLCSEAGIKGSPKFLRRSAATHAEAANPGSASILLGHSTPGLAKKHYIDPAQLPVVSVPQTLPLPMSISYSG